MDPQLQALLDNACEAKISIAEREAQRISLAFDNSQFENENITRETVIQESAKLKVEQNVD